MGTSESNIQDPLNSGYRIYHLIKNGPLDNHGINELSDFIIPPIEVLENKIPFIDWVTSNAGKELSIKIYSLKTRNLKELTIKANEKTSKDGILGGSVRYENWSIAHKKVLHIINVEKNSFGDEKLHLVPEDDYIIAVQPINHQIISLNLDESDPLSILATVIQNCKGKECNFYIYNVKNGARKECALIQNDPYFKLGIEGAYGALHEFPFYDTNEGVEDNNNVTEDKDDEKKEKENGEDKNEEIKEENNVEKKNENNNEEKNENNNEEKNEENIEEKKEENIEEKKEENNEEKKEEKNEDIKEENSEEKKEEEESKEEKSSSSMQKKRKKIKSQNN